MPDDFEMQSNSKRSHSCGLCEYALSFPVRQDHYFFYHICSIRAFISVEEMHRDLTTSRLSMATWKSMDQWKCGKWDCELFRFGLCHFKLICISFFIPPLSLKRGSKDQVMLSRLWSPFRQICYSGKYILNRLDDKLLHTPELSNTVDKPERRIVPIFVSWHDFKKMNPSVVTTSCLHFGSRCDTRRWS